MGDTYNLACPNEQEDFDEFLLTNVKSQTAINAANGTFLLSNFRYAKERSESVELATFLEQGSSVRPELGAGKIAFTFQHDSNDQVTFTPNPTHTLIVEMNKNINK